MKRKRNLYANSGSSGLLKNTYLENYIIVLLKRQLKLNVNVTFTINAVASHKHNNKLLVENSVILDKKYR